jgi:hypothetical protein
VFHDNRVMLELRRHSGLPLPITLDRFGDHELLTFPVDDLRAGAGHGDFADPLAGPSPLPNDPGHEKPQGPTDGDPR